MPTWCNWALGSHTCPACCSCGQELRPARLPQHSLWEIQLTPSGLPHITRSRGVQEISRGCVCVCNQSKTWMYMEILLFSPRGASKLHGVWGWNQDCCPLFEDAAEH